MHGLRIRNLTQKSGWQPATIVKLSNDAIVVRASQSFRYSEAAAIESEERLLLADVIWGRPDDSTAGLEIKHVLSKFNYRAQLATGCGRPLIIVW